MDIDLEIFKSKINLVADIDLVIMKPKMTIIEDIDFDIYKKARELMESSGMIMLPQQEVQAGGVQFWQLRRQATSASNGFAMREFQCLMRHLCKCNVGLRIVEGPGFMQLERL